MALPVPFAITDEHLDPADRLMVAAKPWARRGCSQEWTKYDCKFTSTGAISKSWLTLFGKRGFDLKTR